MRGRWGEEPFAELTASLAAGIAASTLLRHYWFAALALGAGAFLVSALLALRRGRLTLCFCLGLGAIVLDGTLLGLADRDGFPARDVRSLVARRELPLGEPLLLDACVLEDAERRGPMAVTTVALRGLLRNGTWLRGAGRVRLRVSLPADLPIPGSSLRCGDRIRAWAECDVPRNYRNPGSPDRTAFLDRQGIRLIARVKSPRLIEVLPGDCCTVWDRLASSVRRSLRERIRQLGAEGDPEQAAVLSSIVLGDYEGLSADTREEFQNAGTYHVLVVSGLHVSWIALVMIRIFRCCRLPLGVSRLLGAAAVLFYAGVVGFQASISRALWMFGLVLAGMSLFRRAPPANTVLACAFLLLGTRPGWLRDAGFQLSFLSVAAIVLVGMPVMERLVRPVFEPLRRAGDPDSLSLEKGRWHAMGRRLRFRAEVLAEWCTDRWQEVPGRFCLAASRGIAAAARPAAGMIVASMAVQIWLNPVLAFYFNRISWIATVANLAAVPLSSLVLAAGMTAAVLTALTPAAWPAFRAAGSLASLLLQTNRMFAGLPGAWDRCPTPPALWVLAGLALLFLWSIMRWRRLWLPCVAAALQVGCLALWPWNHPPPAWATFDRIGTSAGGTADSRLLLIHFLDVGQGDSMVIRFPDGRVWVIDAGGLRLDPAEPGDAVSFDIGEAVVSRFLWSQWIVRLDRIILTHPHQDHAGGMLSLLRNLPPQRLDYWDAPGDRVLRRLKEEAGKHRVRLHALAAGEEWNVGGVAVRILHPVAGRAYRSLNDGSVVARLEYGRFSALLAGDLEEAGEAEVVSRTPKLASLLLKVAHHGSRSASGAVFLDRTRPRWAVISEGRTNPFGNPSPEALGRLAGRGARLLLTPDQGAVTMETDGSRYWLRSHVLGLLEQGILPASNEKR